VYNSVVFAAVITSSGLFGCDLDQINERPNENGSFLDPSTWLLKVLKPAAVNLRLWRVVSNSTGSNWQTAAITDELELWTGAAFFSG
jgi:hypothetical protein